MWTMTVASMCVRVCVCVRECVCVCVHAFMHVKGVVFGEGGVLYRI